MVQFETKHMIGDITDISFMKIKLNEIEDYSNVKEVKNVGRTIYLPNSYIFTKVFYNYSRKKDGLISDLLEFEVSLESDFTLIEQVTSEVFDKMDFEYKLTFTLNTLKTAVILLISYQCNYKLVSKKRGEIALNLLKTYSEEDKIFLKASKAKSNEK